MDSRGAVTGIDGLRVVDASIMPAVPSVALNPTTIMIAERIAKVVYAGDTRHRDVRVASLRGQIGFVLQDVFLFNATLRENIAFGLTGASDPSTSMGTQ